MGKRNEQTVSVRPDSDELKKINKLVALKNERGEKPSTWHKYTPSRVMIDAAIKEYEQEYENAHLIGIANNAKGYCTKPETT